MGIDLFNFLDRVVVFVKPYHWLLLFLFLLFATLRGSCTKGWTVFFFTFDLYHSLRAIDFDILGIADFLPKNVTIVYDAVFDLPHRFASYKSIRKVPHLLLYFFELLLVFFLLDLPSNFLLKIGFSLSFDLISAFASVGFPDDACLLGGLSFH